MSAQVGIVLPNLASLRCLVVSISLLRPALFGWDLFVRVGGFCVRCLVSMMTLNACMRDGLGWVGLVGIYSRDAGRMC